jgi:hypothetical protein
MNISVPTDPIIAWAQVQVDAGLCPDVETAIAALRQSLDDAKAESDRDGWLDAKEVFAELRARYAD